MLEIPFSRGAKGVCRDTPSTKNDGNCWAEDLGASDTDTVTLQDKEISC
jgi:hypothetical protein